MSHPIRYCEVVRALDNDRDAEVFRAKMRHNERLGHWLQLPCEHAPPCRDLTEADKQKMEEWDKLDAELKKTESLSELLSIIRNGGGYD